MSRRKARGMYYPVQGTGTCGVALPVPEPLPQLRGLAGAGSWLAPPPSPAGVRKLQEPRRLRRGVGRGPVPERAPGRGHSAPSAWTTRPASSARPARPSHSAGQQAGAGGGRRCGGRAAVAQRGGGPGSRMPALRSPR